MAEGNSRGGGSERLFQLGMHSASKKSRKVRTTLWLYGSLSSHLEGWICGGSTVKEKCESQLHPRHIRQYINKHIYKAEAEQASLD